ncbi:MAG: chaperone NapD [Desulfobulbaceae bacterium]|nr:chaperone NapD [Desulfobulbaceae bacterium]
MEIAGVLVHARSGLQDQVEATLLQMPGVEVHIKTDDDRLVVTIEDHVEASVADTLVNLYKVEGVLSAAMIYQHSEEVAEATTE